MITYIHISSVGVYVCAGEAEQNGLIR